MVKIPVLQNVTKANTILANSLRDTFTSQNILVLNIIASPGAGKTSLLERTIQMLHGELNISVIEGDPTTSIDAERIASAGVPVVQINTGSGCHLEARMIKEALEQLQSDHSDIIVIENVGNLICPTGWDLGEDAKVVIASLPEGDDKPLKYPIAFTTSKALIINKIDLEPYTPSKASVMRENALKINPDLAVFEVSCLTGEGLKDWVNWIKEQLSRKRNGINSN